MPKTKTSIREAFAAKFGEDQAAAIENAAEEHANGVNSENKGSDPFKWALAIVIGWECVSKEKFAKYHGITVSQEEFKRWIREHADLGSHDGDVDYLAMFTGVYQEYLS